MWLHWPCLLRLWSVPATHLAECQWYPGDFSGEAKNLGERSFLRPQTSVLGSHSDHTWGDGTSVGCRWHIIGLQQAPDLVNAKPMSSGYVAGSSTAELVSRRSRWPRTPWCSFLLVPQPSLKGIAGLPGAQTLCSHSDILSCHPKAGSSWTSRLLCLPWSPRSTAGISTGGLKTMSLVRMPGKNPTGS